MTRTILLSMAIGLLACTEMDPTAPGQLVPKTVDQDLDLPHITVNNTLLHAETFGNPTDPMIVVLHGGPGSDYRVLLNCQHLATEGYFVVFYDQRGTGLSPRYPKDSYSIDIFLNDLKGVIAHYRQPGQKVFFLGQSWGAMMATAYVNEYPTEIDGMLLSEPGGLTWDQAKDYVAATQKSVFDEATSDALYHDQFITGSDNTQELLDYKRALSNTSSYAPGNNLGIEGPYPIWRFGAVLQEAMVELGSRSGFDFTRHLDRYSTRVCLVYSENNKAYGLGRAQQVASAFPNAYVNMVPNTGHEMIYFNWAAFYPIARTYFNSLK